MSENTNESLTPAAREFFKRAAWGSDQVKRENELAEQGRWQELGDAIRDYIIGRPDIMEALRESREAAKRGELEFRTPPHETSE